MYCKVCGVEEGVKYRERSRMSLCDSCHKGTPAKAGFDTFAKQTFLRDNPNYFEEHPANRRIAREFYDDYKHSNYGSVAEYWRDR